MGFSIEQIIADELSVKPAQVIATIRLLDEGSTVPFIARYRKEATGSLDDTQLRQLSERLNYLRELDERRQSIIKTISDQGNMTDELMDKLNTAQDKTRLEDLYLPFKPKRTSKATLARDAGLEPLAEKLLADPTLEPEVIANEFINESAGYADTKACLEGARHILMEKISEQADLLSELRDWYWTKGLLKASEVEASTHKEKHKFQDYFEYSEGLSSIPSHRALALFRGRNEGILSIKLSDPETPTESVYGLIKIAQHIDFSHSGRPADDFLQSVVQWTWKVKLESQIELALFKKLREQAEEQAIEIFASNLKDLLMSAPAGHKIVMGLDPALRTGVKVVVVDATGQLLTHTTIFPHVPQKQWDQSLRKLEKLVEMHKVDLISIGNGTGSRETEKLVKELLKMSDSKHTEYMVVNEAGASIYSASELAAQEFPDLDVSLRGAVSIARRLQDPLAELVKIEPKSIGVGQYQHDVNQSKLARSLDAVIEDCVNSVGVNLNTASAALLSKVSGLNATLAENIVNHRNLQGAYPDREALKSVPRLGDKTFEQCAGFLRINGGSNPLDATAVHPESYPLVEQFMGQLKLESIESLLEKSDLLKAIDLDALNDEGFGRTTISDVVRELEKPGRDPRPEFKTVSFKDGVEQLSDLSVDMQLEGVVSNVTNFGAFIDIGVHQDGLVHISEMSRDFVSDPRTLVKAGDIVQVWVKEVDEARKRINLTMVKPGSIKAKPAPKAHKLNTGNRPQKKQQKPQANNSAFGDALAAALSKKNA